MPKADKVRSTKDTQPAVAPPSGKDVKAAKATYKTFAKVYEGATKTFGIGGIPRAKADLSRFVNWPKYVKLQRQARVLQYRLKVPPAINQFTQTVDKATATELLRLANKYRPEDKAAKKQRLADQAAKKASPEFRAACKVAYVYYPGCRQGRAFQG